MEHIGVKHTRFNNNCVGHHLFGTRLLRRQKDLVGAMKQEETIEASSSTEPQALRNMLVLQGCRNKPVTVAGRPLLELLAL